MEQVTSPLALQSGAALFVTPPIQKEQGARDSCPSFHPCRNRTVRAVTVPVLLRVLYRAFTCTVRPRSPMIMGSMSAPSHQVMT